MNAAIKEYMILGVLSAHADIIILRILIILCLINSKIDILKL